MTRLIKELIPIIESSIHAMTVTEKEIAQFFIDGTNLEGLSAESVCQQLHVSKPSLTRFAKKCGFSGYREFTFAYQEARQTPEQESDSLKNDVTRRVMADYDQLLRKTYSVIDEHQLTRLTTLISNAKRIYLFGKGSSAQALREMKMRFTRLGLICDCITDNDELVWTSLLTDPTCLVIGASISGQTRSVKKALLQAKERGAKTVLMTTQRAISEDSPWDELVLLASTDHLAYGNRISPQFPLLLVIDCLFAYYLNADAITHQKRYEKTIIDKEEE